MGIEQSLNSLEPKVRGGECTVARLLRTLAPADAQALVFAIGNQNLTSRQISDALASEGITLTRTTINRHRRKGTPTGCQCQ